MDDYMEYETLQGDTWDSISLDFYNDEYKVNILMNANPQHIPTVIFGPGVVLKIPDIVETANDLLPPWKR